MPGSPLNREPYDSTLSSALFPQHFEFFIFSYTRFFLAIATGVGFAWKIRLLESCARDRYFRVVLVAARNFNSL